jgi:protein-S-isoprenylcysteine O-methyltransferase Ste14
VNLSMQWTQFFLAAVLAVYVGAFVVIMVAVRLNNGENPVGRADWMRNPLALSVDLFALGVFLLRPSWLALGSLILNVVAYEQKIRAEDAYLRHAHGVAYAAYCARIGRYLPRLLKGSSSE